MEYQKCMNCNSEWNAIKKITKCPFCDKNLETKQDTFSSFNDVIKFIVDTYGTDILKNKGKFVSMISDYAPGYIKELRVVRVAMDSGIYLELLKVDKLNEEAQKIAITKAVNKLNDDYLLELSWAERAVEWIVPVLWNHKAIMECGEFAAPKKLSVGQKVFLGKFSYDAWEEKFLEWEILNINKDGALLWSTKCIDTFQFSEGRTNFGWHKSYIRNWLNNDFMKTAFSEEEQLFIQKVKLESNINPTSMMKQMVETIDQIFILDLADFEKYNINCSCLKSKATPYAKRKGINCLAQLDAQYWLRSPGNTMNTQMFVDEYGKCDVYGNYVHATGKGVRPALWVDSKYLIEISG